MPMSAPRVSVCMPNLNAGSFLEERLESILAQTFKDWEAIVMDSYSDDGSWELLEAYGRRDARLQLHQVPREGIYAGLNRCIEASRGQYVYIATSDDTMLPTCLEEMVAAMDAHPQCDLCHTPLIVIDEQGRETEGWWESATAGRYFGRWKDRLHIRQAPHDGLVHCGIRNLYISLTQLLIRRSLFDRIGLFRGDWGPRGDFEWDMRASLVASTLHLPRKLATWRQHAAQATVSSARKTEDCRAYLEMADAAFDAARQIDPTLADRLNRKRLRHVFEHDWHVCHVAEARGVGAKAARMFRYLLDKPLTCIGSVSRRLGARTGAEQESYGMGWISREIERLGYDICLKPLDE